jgi:hypothetical protein
MSVLNFFSEVVSLFVGSRETNKPPTLQNKCEDLRRYKMLWNIINLKFANEKSL